MDPREKDRMTRSIVQLVISLIALFLLRILVDSLPVLSDSGPVPGFDVSVAVLAKAGVDTLILVVVLAFGRQLSGHVQALRPSIRDLSTILYLTVVVVVMGIAYKVYEDVAFGLLDGDVTIYSWIFLIAILVPLGYLAFLVFQNLEAVTDVILSRGTFHPVKVSRDEDSSCPNCGTIVGAEEKFCTSCGTKLEVTQRRSEERSCPSCGTENSPGAKFCRSCGAPLGDRPTEESRGRCPKCGGSNSSEARFCRHCGTDLASSPTSNVG